MGDNKRDKGSDAINGALSLTISALIVKALGLIYKIPLSNILGDEGMGYFNSAYTVYAFFYLLCTAGVPKAVMILISESKAKESRTNEIAIVRVATLAFVLLGVGLSAIFILFSAPLSQLIGNSRARATMIAIAPSILFVSIAGVIRGYLSANMRLLDIAVSQIIDGVGKLALGLIFASLAERLQMPLDLISAFTILGVTFGALFGLLYLYICYKKQISSEKVGQNIEIGERANKIVKRILAVSLPITVSAAIMSATNIIDLTFIMRSLESIGYSDSEASALYGNYTTLAVPMFNLAISIVTPISIAFMPSFVRAQASGDAVLLKESISDSIRFTAILSAPMLIGMSVFSEEILSLLFGNSGVRTGASLLCLIAPAIFFSSHLLTVNSALEAGGQVYAPLVAMVFGSIVKIVMGQIMLTNPEFGISGAPIGTVVCYAVALIISSVFYTVKLRSPLPLISSSALPYISAFLSVALARYAYMRLYSSLAPVLSLSVAILTAGVIYLVLLVFSGTLRLNNLRKTAKYTKMAL